MKSNRRLKDEIMSKGFPSKPKDQSKLPYRFRM